MLWILLGLTSFLALVWGLEELDRRKRARTDQDRRAR